MPLARIAIPEHLSNERARALSKAVHCSLVETCAVPEKDLFHLISRYAKDDMIIDPTYPDVQRSPDASIVEVLFLVGRTTTQKALLFAALADRAEAAGFRRDDIMIALTENAPTDWSAGGGRVFGK
ncbi:tautomerase family protein [Bradyrhizobium sp. HKCCYLS2038]|uniref:tautomerase family protein n=1 Tax=unclassified Bradyrhizobium TaxID=2631580 RepID=UPI003EBD5DEE